ncbi:MAG: FtsX-like permease family protein [Anaerolineales bacterium]|nr:FtsX-like permease family protein [Anaerolineales bacterium]
MTLSNLIWTAWQGLSKNRVRAVLTSLGIIIGVASVIATLALGNGTRAAVEAKFRFLGSDQIQISTKYKTEQGERVPTGEILSYEDGILMSKYLEYIDYVEMTIFNTVRLRNGRVALSNVVIQGTMANYLDSQADGREIQPAGWAKSTTPDTDSFIAHGRFYTPAEVVAAAEVCVLGHQTAEDLFEGSDPIGEAILVNRKSCEVIGVLAELESVNPVQREGSELDEGIYMPVSTTIRDLFEEEPSMVMTAHVTDEAMIDEASAEITSYLRERHGIKKDAEGFYADDFHITTKKDLIGAQQEAARAFSFLLTALASVSLVVGGIGIMNVMLVSVTERTREIGIRRAVGAKKIDVVMQFLMEALLLSAISGILGIALGIIFIPTASSLMDDLALLDPLSIPLAFCVALFTGVTFGLYPALRASQLEPIDALRYE